MTLIQQGFVKFLIIVMFEQDEKNFAFVTVLKNQTLVPREGVIIDHHIIMIFPLGIFYKRFVFSSPLFPKVNNGRPLLTA